jgi:hypothetical protein
MKQKQQKKIQRINERKSWFFKKISEITGPSNLTKMRRKNPNQ